MMKRGHQLSETLLLSLKRVLVTTRSLDQMTNRDILRRFKNSSLVVGTPLRRPLNLKTTKRREQSLSLLSKKDFKLSILTLMMNYSVSFYMSSIRKAKALRKCAIQCFSRCLMENYQVLMLHQVKVVVNALKVALQKN